MSAEVTTSPEAAGWLSLLLAKFLPPAVGAFIMILFDPPKTKSGVFTRAFVAFAFTWLFSGLVGDVAHSWVHAIDPDKHSHRVAIYGFCGSIGWAVMSALALVSRKLAADPVGTLKDFRT